MKKETIELLLTSIKEKGIIKIQMDGDQIIEAVQFAIRKQLISRTSMGNFVLADTGAQLLDGRISWEFLRDDRTTTRSDYSA